LQARRLHRSEGARRRDPRHRHQGQRLDRTGHLVQRQGAERQAEELRHPEPGRQAGDRRAEGSHQRQGRMADGALRQARLGDSVGGERIGASQCLPHDDRAKAMPLDIYLNVAVSGLLTGLVYGLMALGLSVIFGVVRVVNFAHGEMMTIAMYLAIVLFQAFKLDPLIMMVPIAGVLFALGYVMQAGLINPFVDRPEHAQFILLVAIAIIMVNVLLLIFGPDARSVQTSYAFDSFAFGPVIVDA